VLIGCAKTKGPAPCPARDLYISPLFRKARQYAENLGAEWWILSAEHGLLHPDTFIAPYETTLLAMTREKRRTWAAGVHRQLLARRLLPGFRGPTTILAGAAYREHLVPWLTLDGFDPKAVTIPLAGLGIGRQLAWLTRATHTPLPPTAPNHSGPDLPLFASRP
jgi:hypothetical protein